jgi:RimJ/RimL family protein N-acetyltransferase
MLAGGTLRGVLRHPDPPLSDGEILLRAKTSRDVEALVEICSDPEIPRWTRVPSRYTPEDALAWMAASELELAAGRSIDWLVVDADGEILASVAIQDIKHEHGAAEIGYWVAAPARGRGIATRAVRLVAEWARRELGLRTLEIRAHEDNAASQGVARAAGFVETGETHVPPRDGLAEGRYVVHTWPAG